MKKKIISALLGTTIALTSLCGCGMKATFAPEAGSTQESPAVYVEPEYSERSGISR